jgi:hypothetical protein
MKTSRNVADEYEKARGEQPPDLDITSAGKVDMVAASAAQVVDVIVDASVEDANRDDEARDEDAVEPHRASYNERGGG